MLVARVTENGERLLVLEPEQHEHREGHTEDERAHERARDEHRAVLRVEGKVRKDEPKAR